MNESYSGSGGISFCLVTGARISTRRARVPQLAELWLLSDHMGTHR